MSYLHALLLGIIQGITEFFPISSSAHLKLSKILFNLDSSSYSLDLFCHFGTTFALCLFLRKELTLLFTKNWKELFYFIVALIPLVPIYFFLKSYLLFFSRDQFIGYFWMFTSLLLFLSIYLPIPYKKSQKSSYSSAFLVGIAQTLALIPGISRSGATISMGIFQGWTVQKAILFSFLLSIPTILGGSFLELVASKESNFSIGLSELISFLSSFIVGSFCVRFIFSFTEKKKLLPFAWYCLFIGFFVSIYLNVYR